MAGLWSHEPFTENRLELTLRERRASGRPVLDLTDTNPTRHGILFPPALLRDASSGYWDSRSYEPNARGAPSARAAIARYYASRTPPLSISPQNIFLTAGTSEAYTLLFSILADPGDAILAPQITYPLFDILAAHQRIALRPYELDENEEWQIDEAGLRELVDSRSRAVLIVSPHNPLGCIHARPSGTLTEAGLPIISDEVFAEFTCATIGSPPLGALYPELPVFHLGGISKMLALPDLKLSWIAMNDRAARQFSSRLEVLNDSFLSCNSLVQFMLPALLDGSGSFRNWMRSELSQRVECAYRTLRGCPSLTVHKPEGAYFLFPKLREERDEEELALDLLERGVYVHPGYFYGSARGTRFMVSACVRPDVLVEGLSILTRFLTTGI